MLSLAQIAADVDLFVALGADTQSPQSAVAAVRERLVTVDRELLETARVNVGHPSTGAGVLRLNLFEDAVFNAVFDNTGPTSTGYWLTGHLVDNGLSDVTLVVNREVITGTVRAPGGTYAIRPVRDGVHVVRRIDPNARPSLRDDVVRPVVRVSDPPVVPPGPHRERPTRPPDTPPSATIPEPQEDGARVDILVVYTSEAKADHGGHRAITALIDLFVAETNQAYADSGVLQRLHLVHTAEVDYVEHGVPSNDILDHLTSPSDGKMDEVHTLRNRYSADIIHLMVDDQIVGRAWPLVPFYGDPQYAQSVAFNFLGYTDGLIFAHENGHNMGLQHDRYAELKYGPPTNLTLDWVPAYVYGYVNQRAFEPDVASTCWFTIMAYGDQCRDSGLDARLLPRFSNPDQTHEGAPLGIPGDKPSSSVTGPADARRTLNETRRIVANFRVAPCLREGARTSLQANNGQYLTAENGGGAEVLADRDEAGAWERFTLVDHNGGCLESGDAASLRTSDGFYLRADRGGAAGLDASGTSVGAWERFTVHRRAGAGAIRSGDFIAIEAPDGHYVIAAMGGGGAVHAGGTQVVEAWETFKIAAAPSTGIDNGSPVAVGTLPDLTLQAGGDADVDVSAAFRDPDGDPLTYDATSSAPTVASVKASGSRVGVEAVAAGTAIVTVAATDTSGSNSTATQAFGLTVGVPSTLTFTDDPIVPGVTPVKAIHFTELRESIDRLRGAAGLGPFSWTDPVLMVGVTPVRLEHLMELRVALAGAYGAAGRAAPPWTDAAPAAGVTPVRAVHLTELRAAVMALE